MDWVFAVMFLLVAILIMLSPMYKSSKSFHKNMFGASEVQSQGGVGVAEVFVVTDKSLGKMVGLVFKGGDEDQRMSITSSDALLLAQWLEAEAAQASRARDLPDKK
jgi:hypothetical protein